jgi:predicted nucleic acid-binding protein
MELRFGAALRDDTEAFWKKIREEIFSKVTILPFETDEAVTAGNLLATFEKAGQMVGTEDILIASTALRHGCVMVTANISHFSRVKALRVENWLEPV